MSVKLIYKPMADAFGAETADQAAASIMDACLELGDVIVSMAERAEDAIRAAQPDATVEVAAGATTVIRSDGRDVFRLAVEDLGLAEKFRITADRVGAVDVQLGNVLASPAVAGYEPAVRADIRRAVAGRLMLQVTRTPEDLIDADLASRGVTFGAAAVIDAVETRFMDRFR